MPVPAGQASGLMTSFRLSAGLINLSTVVTKQSTETLHKYYVCGLETLAVASSTVYDFIGTVSSSDGTIANADLAGWFTVDASASGATTSCVVNRYELFQSDQTTALAATVASIDATSGDLLVKQTSQAAKSSYYVKATTMGSKTILKEFTITINVATSCSSALSVS